MSIFWQFYRICSCRIRPKIFGVIGRFVPRRPWKVLVMLSGRAALIFSEQDRAGWDNVENFTGRVAIFFGARAGWGPPPCCFI